MFTVLRVPAGFASLQELYLDNAPLDDYDMVYVQHLPALARLFLSFTGIGDEACVFFFPASSVWLRQDVPQHFSSCGPSTDSHYARH